MRALYAVYVLQLKRNNEKNAAWDSAVTFFILREPNLLTVK